MLACWSWPRISGVLRALLALMASRTSGLAEHLREEVAEIGVAAGIALAAEVKVLLIPVGRRAKASAALGSGILRKLHLVAHGVVGGALFGVGEYGVGFVDLGHASVRIFFLADVGVVFAGELAIGLLDVLGGGLLSTPSIL
jgi:hypothetical protein